MSISDFQIPPIIIEHSFGPIEVVEPTPELSIVMPCLNESRTIPVCIEKARQFLEENNVRGEIIVSDNGSTDGSQDLARSLGARVIDCEAKGYGNALYAGITAARGQYVIMGDSDDSYDFYNLKPFVEKLREGHDLVMGNRFRGGIKPGAMPPLHQYFGNPGLTLLAKMFFNTPVGDVYCGLRGFRKDAFQRMDMRTTGMEFALEMVVKATLLKMKIAEVPTTLSPDGRDRAPHLKSWRDGRRSLRFYLLCSPGWLFLFPGLALILLGGLVGGRILLGPVQFGDVNLDIHTLLYCAIFVLVGFQAVFFSLYAKVLAVSSRLLPPSPRIQNFVNTIRLEQAVFFGALFLVGGIAATLFALGLWQNEDMGALDPFRMMRIIIPAVLAIALGFQIIFGSIYLSLVKGQLRQSGIRR